jgi:hypothetical protein
MLPFSFSLNTAEGYSMEEPILGIDLERMDGERGIYGVYESLDGGNEWSKLAESTKVYELIQFARSRYDEDTPMVMHDHIQKIMMYEVVEEAERYKIKVRQDAEKANKQNQGWFSRFTKFFKKKE